MNELGVYILEVGEDEKLFEVGVVAYVAVFVWIGVTSFAGGLAEECDIEDVGFVCVGDGSLLRGDLRRNEMGLNRVGVNSVIDLGKGAVEILGERGAAAFVFLEALKFLDEVEFKFGAEP